MKNAQPPNEAELSALNSVKFTSAPKFTPRQARVCIAFMRMPAIWREQVDAISGASNGPEIMRQLKLKGLQWTCEKHKKKDKDGIVCEPGLYTITGDGIATLRRWGY